jgi:hypothetical protein
MSGAISALVSCKTTEPSEVYIAKPSRLSHITEPSGSPTIVLEDTQPNAVLKVAALKPSPSALGLMR